MSKVDFSDLKILIAEDSKFMRQICRAILISNGARHIIEATDGAEALELFTEQVPDVVVLDLNMPILDGFDVLRIMRDQARSPRPDVPIIILSGHSERWRVKQARALGATAYLVKPVSASALNDRISTAVLRSRTSHWIQ